MTVEDPFSNPTPRVSAFASADSFRGRLIMIEPTLVERDLPKTATQPNGPKGDRVTADVTTLDGLGPVQIYSNRVPSGRYLDGPLHRKVWFNQDQLSAGLQTPDGKSLLSKVLCRIDTLRPGTPAGQGNPWVMTPATDEEKQQAIAELARLSIEGASAPTAPKVNPFDKR